MLCRQFSFKCIKVESTCSYECWCLLQALESYIDLTLVEAVVMCLTRLQPLLRSVGLKKSDIFSPLTFFYIFLFERCVWIRNIKIKPGITGWFWCKIIFKLLNLVHWKILISDTSHCCFHEIQTFKHWRGVLSNTARAACVTCVDTFCLEQTLVSTSSF